MSMPVSPDNLSPAPKKRVGLAKQIFAALFLGILFGHFYPAYGVALKPVGDVFLRMIKMLIVPLIFATLVTGVAGAGDFKKMGRLGLKTMIWFQLATTVAMIYGLIVSNLVQPGAGVAIINVDPQAAAAAAKKSFSIIDVLVNVVPNNIVEAAASANLLQIVFFSCFFGVAVAAMKERGKIIIQAAEALQEAMFFVTNYVMKLTPIGVFGFAAFTVGRYGLKLVIPLAKLIGSLYLGLFVFILTVLVVACLLIKVNFFQLLRVIKEPLAIAFTTASSEAALPLTIEKLEKFGVPKHIIGFVLPTGYAFNLDGSVLYHIMAVVFIAQMYGVPMDLSSQLMVILTLAVAQKGTAGVPGAAMIVLAAIIPMFNLPIEGLFMIIGVDRIMDMGRTAVNLAGNVIATLVVARWENELPDDLILAAYTKNYDE
ncbi:MAG: cation:dicarboxylase symporter family transporter [Negativicutes bacterium]|nr:cation:dicarboxylase symporter family transporter [Negativicutes bacterium]